MPVSRSPAEKRPPRITHSIFSKFGLDGGQGRKWPLHRSSPCAHAYGLAACTGCKSLQSINCYSEYVQARVATLSRHAFPRVQPSRQMEIAHAHRTDYRSVCRSCRPLHGRLALSGRSGHATNSSPATPSNQPNPGAGRWLASPQLESLPALAQHVRASLGLGNVALPALHCPSRLLVQTTSWAAVVLPPLRRLCSCAAAGPRAGP
jgi:hypothetical protein